MQPQPAYDPPDRVPASLRERGYAVLDAQGVCALAGCAVGELEALQPSWDALPPDQYL